MAVAFNSVDTLLAPFIKKDNLSYPQIKQELQNFVFSINSNSRWGAEPAFTNITLDITPTEDLIDTPCIVGGEVMDFTYRECQHEMNMFSKAFCEIMLEGDADGKLFSYPIPTINIHPRFDWDNPNNDLLWTLAGKYGTPYFANFCNSDMKPSDVRSMCCRLRIDLSEIRKKNGGLFGAGDSTGSIGVVTINLPRVGYVCSNGMYDENMLISEILELVNQASKSLEIKRKWLEDNIVGHGLIPAFDEYVGTIDNHFSSIGIVGLNEMCVNYLGKDITTPAGKALALKVEKAINQRILEIQKETGHLYNFEATPAESTAYRLAMKDKEMFPEIFTQGSGSNVYYTNSCHIPVNKITGIHDTFSHQEDLQVEFSGGTVIHVYLDGAISPETAKTIVRTCCTEYKVPYMSLSPISRVCPEHGYVDTKEEICPICSAKLKLFQRITGYLREVENFNDGKRAEFNDRVQLNGSL